MTGWYILPNGNIKNVNGLELQPEQDWFPTEESMAAFTEAERAKGKSDVDIIRLMMELAVQAEQWAQDNLQ